jgi:ATP-dependent RNA helicase DDX56/DBP9
LAGSPDILVATPGRVAVHLNSSLLKLDSLTHLVIDEADLILSYGYDEDLATISKSVPKGVQTFLMSATLKAELDSLKGLFCRNPILLALDEEESDDNKVSQYMVKCAEDEKFLLCYAIFILKLIKGKTIIFVGDIDRCYRLKLFLEQFAIKSCVLNSELPVNSRIHVVEEFNKNVYDIIIATDEHEVLGDEHEPRKQLKEIEEANADEDGEDKAEKAEDVIKENGEGLAEAEPEESTSQPAKKKRKGSKRDKDYGVARGIDFKNVACVLNFDLPTSSRSYTHRIGRTARAGKTGMALSFVIPKAEYRKHKPTSIPSAKNDEEILAKITKQQEKKGSKVEPYAFDMKKLEGFRYRLGDALRAVTNGAIREARVKELRQELIKSEKLKRHFEENPEDLKHLRHDGELRAARVQPHLRHVPDYLIPGGGTKAIESEAGFVALNNKASDNKMRKGRGRGSRRVGAARKGPVKKANPLQYFKAKASR